MMFQYARIRFHRNQPARFNQSIYILHESLPKCGAQYNVSKAQCARSRALVPGDGGDESSVHFCRRVMKWRVSARGWTEYNVGMKANLNTGLQYDRIRAVE